MCKPTPRMRSLLEAARVKVRRRGDRHLGPEHLLLAMLGDEGGIAGWVLRDHADPEGAAGGSRGGHEPRRRCARPAGPASARRRGAPRLRSGDPARKRPAGRARGRFLGHARRPGRRAGHGSTPSRSRPHRPLPRALSVADMDRALAFYRDALRLLPRTQSRRGRRSSRRATRRSCFAPEGPGTPRPPPPEVSDLEEARAAITAAGGRMVGPADPFGRATVTDPEGNALVLIQWRAEPLSE
jgi:predicted enzyme related to lactoylglutathione lyase